MSVINTAGCPLPLVSVLLQVPEVYLSYPRYSLPSPPFSSLKFKVFLLRLNIEGGGGVKDMVGGGESWRERGHLCSA